MHIVKRVCCFETPVHRMVHDGGGQRVETQEVRHFPIRLSDGKIKKIKNNHTDQCHRGRAKTFSTTTIYLHKIGVNNVLLGQKPVFHLLLVHDRHKVELAQVFTEKAMHHWHILLGHRSQTRSLWSLKEEGQGKGLHLKSFL